MAKLYFHYSTMNAGKSTGLLQASHNYVERGMQTYLLTARLDDRAGAGRIASRIGIGQSADTFDGDTDLFARIEARLAQGPCACVFIDEAQFLTERQVWQLARAVDDLNLPVMCYGLRVDFLVSSTADFPPRSPRRRRARDDHRGPGPDRRERDLRLALPPPLARGNRRQPRGLTRAPGRRHYSKRGRKGELHGADHAPRIELARRAALALLMLAAACSPRPGPEALNPAATPPDPARVHRIYVVTTRAARDAFRSEPSFVTRYGFYDVSVPPDHGGT